MTPKQRKEAAMLKQQATRGSTTSRQRSTPRKEGLQEAQERRQRPRQHYPRETPPRRLQRQQGRPRTAREPQQKRSVPAQRRLWRFAAILILTPRNTSATVPASTRYGARSLMA